jgi:hypothetical protein
MASNDTKRTGFRIANGPVVSRQESDQIALVSDFAELPKAFGGPTLFAVARDPRTLFVYWNIDWEEAFADAPPLDRQVYLRVLRANGEEESQSLIEPLLGSYYATVAKPRETYRVELGYYERSGRWRSVAISDVAIMPPDSVSENQVVDVATVPFHLSFQKMIDLFRESNGDALTNIIGRLQDRAVGNETLSDEESEIFRAMNLSAEDLAARRQFASGDEDKVLRKRAEAILGYGATSPAGGFTGSSRA